MKILVLFIISQLLMACMLLPQPMESRRKPLPATADLDNLERLLLNEQQSIYQSTRTPSSVENVRLGMQKNRVKRQLGLPTHVEVAGNPKYENERWIYERSVPTLEGYYNEKQVIYFEEGSVVGWESQ